jgi:hypothetical protein
VDRDFVTGKMWRLSLSDFGMLEICREDQWSDTLEYALFQLSRQDQAFLITTDKPHATVTLTSRKPEEPSLLLTFIANHVDQKHYPHNSLMLLLTNTSTSETLVSMFLNRSRLAALPRLE